LPIKGKKVDLGICSVVQIRLCPYYLEGLNQILNSGSLNFKTLSEKIKIKYAKICPDLTVCFTIRTYYFVVFIVIKEK
jgi:hypothetical protein